MKILHEVAETRAWSLDHQKQGRKVGLVPTMGFLHEGHLSLIRIAREHCDVVMVSIFVNPTQFGPGEDLDAYPRDFEGDQARCESAGASAIFYPTPAVMYAPDHTVFVNEQEMARGLCGKSRPSHFRGVLTVVAKLFNICCPQVAVFGEKDAQQIRLIRRMVRDLNFSVGVISGPIVREADGLAMSSRNKYLTEVERSEAPVIRRALLHAEALFQSGERDPEVLKGEVAAMIAQAPAGEIDYIECVDDQDLQPLRGPMTAPALIAVAVWFGQARLLDNIVLPPPLAVSAGRS